MPLNTTFRGRSEPQDKPWKRKTETNMKKANSHFRKKKKNHIQGTGFKKDRSERLDGTPGTGEGRGHPSLCAAQERGPALRSHTCTTDKLSRRNKGVGMDEVPVIGGPHGDRWKAGDSDYRTLQEKGTTDQCVSCKRAPQKISN